MMLFENEGRDGKCVQEIDLILCALCIELRVQAIHNEYLHLRSLDELNEEFIIHITSLI